MSDNTHTILPCSMLVLVLYNGAVVVLYSGTAVVVRLYSGDCVGRFLDQLLCKTHAAIDEWQTEMLLRALRVGKVQLYSPLMSSRPDDVAASGVMLRP